VENPVILAHSKGHLNVSQWLSRNQLMEYDYKDDYNICVRSTHMDSLSTLLHSMLYVNHNNSIVRLLPTDTTAGPDVT